MGKKYRTAKYLKLIVYGVVIVLVNVVGLTLFFRFDLTKNDIYSISEASQKVVATLQEPLTINVFFTKDLPAPHNNTERYLHDLLAEYAQHANHFFNYKFYNVNPDSATGTKEARSSWELANTYGINPIQIQVFEKDEVKFKRAYMGLVLIHGDMIEKIPTITSTDGLEYQLTTTIQKMNNKISTLLSLSDSIQVKLVLSSSLLRVAPLMGLQNLAGYPEKLEEIIGKLNNKNYGKLAYTRLDPSQNPDLQTALKKYTLQTLSWPDIPEKNVAAGSGFIGLIMEYGKKARALQLLQVIRIPIFGTQYNLVGFDQLEETINGNLEALVDINEDLGYLADHGTLSASSFAPMGRQDPNTLGTFSKLISQNYSLKYINLKDGAIPDSLGCMVIVRPTEKFTDYELYQIDQALMRGTNLAVVLDAFNEIMPQNQRGFGRGPTYAPLDTGLEKLLTHYGVRLKRSFVMDENCHRQRVSRAMGGGERPIYFAPLIKNQNINHNLDFMKNIKGLVAVKASPLVLDEERIAKNKITASKLFASSEKSWEMSRRINLHPMMLSQPPADTERKSFPLAYLLEGQFPSYFAGKSLPEKKSKETKSEDTGKQSQGKETPMDLSKVAETGSFLAKGRPAKVFLLASSEMLKDTVLDPDGNSPNDLFVMNVIDALNNRQEIAVMRSKEQRFNPLKETEAVTKTFIKTVNIAGLPLLVVVFGLFVWMRRASRKKQIRMMFHS